MTSQYESGRVSLCVGSFASFGGIGSVCCVLQVWVDVQGTVVTVHDGFWCVGVHLFVAMSSCACGKAGGALMPSSIFVSVVAPSRHLQIVGGQHVVTRPVIEPSRIRGSLCFSGSGDI